MSEKFVAVENNRPTANKRKTASRRSRMDIIYDMLKAIHNKGGRIKPTHLLYKSNLSHSLMVEYVDELTEKGMIDMEEEPGKRNKKGKKFYILLQKGIEFLAEYRKMKNFQEAFGL